MAGDTLGDCPICGHKEQSYDDWESLGPLNLKTARGSLKTLAMRVFRCRNCRGLITPDSPE